VSWELMFTRNVKDVMLLIQQLRPAKSSLGVGSIWSMCGVKPHPCVTVVYVVPAVIVVLPFATI